MTLPGLQSHGLLKKKHAILNRSEIQIYSIGIRRLILVYDSGTNIKINLIRNCSRRYKSKTGVVVIFRTRTQHRQYQHIKKEIEFLHYQYNHIIIFN